MGKVRKKVAVRRLVAALSLYILSLMRLAVVFAWFQKRCKMRRLVTSSVLHGARKNRRFWMKDRGRRTSWWDTEVPKFGDEEWIKHFRMTKKTFDKLVKILEEDMMPGYSLMREPIPTAKRIAMALFYLANGVHIREMVKFFGVHQGTAHRYTHRFCDGMIRKYSQFIRMPDAEESTKISAVFEEKFQLPQFVGSIGSHHVHAFTPEAERERFSNSAGWGSFVLQAVVDNQYRFRDVFCEMPGGTDLYSVFQKSKIFWDQQLPDLPTTIHDTEVPLVLAADKQYPLLPWLITPYAGKALTSQQKAFNLALKDIQNYPQEAFKRLVARWQILQRKVQIRIDSIPSVVTVCCMLHNICEATNAPLLEEWFKDPEVVQPVEEACVEFADEGVAVRDALCWKLAETFDTKTSGDAQSETQIQMEADDDLSSL